VDDVELRLDGNAAAGVLREVFVYDLSGATGQCAACGAIFVTVMAINFVGDGLRDALDPWLRNR
jgi:hypothetical protein